MFKKNCLHCGKEFRPLIGTQMYCCRSCYELAKKKRAEIYNRKKREERAARKNRTLDEILKEIEEYNKKHGTFISYGQYMSMRNAR